MSSLSAIEKIVQEAKDAFIEAKADGKLEAAEVVQIASSVSQKIHRLQSLSSADKRALTVLCLKKGLAAAGGLQGLAALAESGPAGLEAAEKQVLDAAMAAVGGLMAAAPRLFASATRWGVPPALLACLPFCSEALAVLEPKDAALIHEAFACVAGKADLPSNRATNLESVGESSTVTTIVDANALVAPLQKTLEESTLLPTLLGAVPSRTASPVESPEPAPAQ